MKLGRRKEKVTKSSSKAHFPRRKATAFQLVSHSQTSFESQLFWKGNKRKSLTQHYACTKSLYGINLNVSALKFGEYLMVPIV
ncbi:CLUMA_CG014961, isoform A [Clunio marinus]|uniref:CLUMA_CG014961, isoform A n=1 Tax=Clunio marinus TaxID=568069 RepID=A0A1J1ITB1_9DIPT|nr:CLUMA_CG014961, isoform A [Clunio marinus]